jgi:hypothetical protein
MLVILAQEATVIHHMILSYTMFGTDESLVSLMGAIWHLMGGGWQHMGAAFTIWGPYGSHMCHMGAVCLPYGSGVRRMGAIWEPCAHVSAILCQIGGGWCHMGAVCNV